MSQKKIFVVQKHAASHLHYDFRLEMDGVLKSWAVPKGPPQKQDIKRLAVETEDHPLSYATFAGTITEGYGKGTVEIWDAGTYENISEKDHEPISMADAYKKGHIKVALQGKKLKGVYTLIKMRGKNWLLIKVSMKYLTTYKKMHQ